MTQSFDQLALEPTFDEYWEWWKLTTIWENLLKPSGPFNLPSASPVEYNYSHTAFKCLSTSISLDPPLLLWHPKPLPSLTSTTYV
jgi:hypothetical protein